MERVEQLIKKIAPIAEIRNSIFSSKLEITDYVYKNGLDLMHCAIEQNHPEVVELLLVHKQWPSFNHDDTKDTIRIPHLHFAAKLGRAPIINMILHNRPQEHEIHWPRQAILDADLLEMSFNVEKSGKIVAYKIGIPDNISALDIAAIYKHHNCVQNLLMNISTDKKAESLLEKAAQVNNPLSLLCLLEHESCFYSQIEGVFKVAVKYKHPECLKILLSLKPEFVKQYKGVNPYHIMYCQSSGFSSYFQGKKIPQELLYVNLPKCTEVLLAHKMNPAIPEIPGFYALHSLIELMASDVEWNYTVRQFDENVQEHLSSHEDTVIKYQLETLRILLKAGLSPNYDEYMHTTEEEVGLGPLSVDESNRSCALDVLFNRGRYLCGEHTADITELLFKFGANPKTPRKGRWSPISLFIQRLYISFSEDIDLFFWKDVGRVLLLYGSDADEAVY